MIPTAFGTPNLTISLSQNTAPVFHFKCLFTYDIRRKNAKRWKDGYLTYHTFNKRVIVTDAARNNIGDTHWSEERVLEDGDELMLDAGVLVQIAEAMGETNTDLTPLLQRRKGENSSPSRITEAPTRSVASYNVGRAASSTPSQIRNKPLNVLLGTRRGPLGKAVLPAKSPYEERQVVAENEWRNEREHKRQRVNAPIESWNIEKTKVRVPKSKPPSPLSSRTVVARNGQLSKIPSKPKGPTENQTRSKVMEGINIVSSAEGPSSDQGSNKHCTLPRSAQDNQIGRQAKLHISNPAPTSQAPASAGDRIYYAQYGEGLRAEKGNKGDSHALPITHLRAQLRIQNVTRRQMLLCQESPLTRGKPKRSDGTNREDPRPRAKKKDAAPYDVPNKDQNPCYPGDVRRARNDLNPDTSPAKAFKKTGGPLEIVDINSIAPDMPETQPSQSTRRNPPANPLNPSMARPGPPSQTRQPPAFTSHSKRPKDMALKPELMDQKPHNKALTAPDSVKQVVATSVIVPKPSNTTAASRPFHRVLSDSSKANQAVTNNRSSALQIRKPLQRSESFNIPKLRMETTSANICPTIAGEGTENEVKTGGAPSLPPDMDVGPWSLEAFDLFDWRPPGYDENGKRLSSAEASKLR